MRVNGKMIRHMDMGLISTLMGLCTKVNGKKTSSMVMGRKHGRMAHVMRVTMLKVKKTERVSSCGQMVPHMKDSSKIIIFMVMENMYGQTKESILDNG